MISVIVTFYNEQRQIRRCIDSVKNQTLKDWELILVDDGSTDESFSIVGTFLDDSRIHYYHKKNGGVSSARNFGLGKASGEWVIFLDADDYFLSEALEVLYSTAIRSGVKVSAGNFYVEKDNKRYGQCVGRSRIVKDNFRSWYYMTCYPRVGAALFHATVVKNVTYDESLCRYEDAKFLFPIMREQKIAFSSDYIMVYSDENSGLSKQTPHPSKNYVFSLDFRSGSFWERIVFAKLVRQETSVYAHSGVVFKRKSKMMSLFMFVEQLVSYSIWPVSVVNRILGNIKGKKDVYSNSIR